MQPRKFGDAWEVSAPAKLNLYLDVLGRRPDGFHELETLMVPIQLYDHLAWRPRGKSLTLRYDDSTPVELRSQAPPDASNLVYRAAMLLARAAGVEPYGEITLTKRIPAQAGLGGGSSDAAATLQLASAAWGLDPTRLDLSQLAAELGSDVPFFLNRGAAVCRGRGDQIETVAGLPRLNVVVVTPNEGVSTAAAFAGLKAAELGGGHVNRPPSSLAALIQYLRTGAVARAGELMKNSLQGVAEALCPCISRLGTVFASYACHAHLLTGSGSAYFGLVRSARHARRIARVLSSANLGRVYATATCR